MQSTPYQRAEHGFGFGETQIGPQRYRVAFAGNTKTTRQTVHKYVLYRAAELAEKDGYAWFVVDDASQLIERYGDLRQRPTERLDLGLEDGDSPADFDNDDDDDNRVRSSVELYEAILDITLYRTEQDIPQPSRDFYEARQVLQDLDLEIERLPEISQEGPAPEAPATEKPAPAAPEESAKEGAAAG